MALASGPEDRRSGPHPLRRALRVLMVAVLALLVADRVAVVAAQRALAGHVQQGGYLAAKPTVSIRGFPFLTQVLAGRYREIDLRARNVERDGVRISAVSVRLSGVTVSISDALSGPVRRVPVEHAAGTALLTYADINALVHRYGGAFGALMTVSGAGPGRVRVSGPAGLSLRAGIAVKGGRLSLQPDPADLSALPPVLVGPVTSVLSTPLPLPALPFGVRVVSGTVNDSGAHLLAGADGIVLPTA